MNKGGESIAKGLFPTDVPFPPEKKPGALEFSFCDNFRERGKGGLFAPPFVTLPLCLFLAAPLSVCVCVVD